MFSLRTLLLAVAVVAVGVVGLTTRNVWWASVFSTLTGGAIVAAFLVAIVSRSHFRWLAVGFVVCAGLYLGVVLSVLFESFTRTLLTTRLISVSWRSLDVPPPPEAGSSPYVTITSGVNPEDIAYYAMSPDLLVGDLPEVREWANELRSFFIVGHCLWGLLFGFFGALLAGYLARERSPPQPVSQAQPPG